MNRITKELKGKKFGSLTVTHISRENLIGCVCSCGKHILTDYDFLRDGIISSCGCDGLAPENSNATDPSEIPMWLRLPVPPPDHGDKGGGNAPPSAAVADTYGSPEFPHILEKKVGMLTVLSRIPKELPGDPPQYLCLCTCGGFTLLKPRSYRGVKMGPKLLPLTTMMENYLKNGGPASGDGNPQEDPNAPKPRDLVLAGSDLQCVCYSPRVRYVPGPLPPEPHVRAEDPFLHERMRAGTLKKYDKTYHPGVYYSHRMYLPGVLFRHDMHFLGSFSSPDYAWKIAQWISRIHLEEWMEKHKREISPERLRLKTRGVNYDYQEKWLQAFDPTRANDKDYLWKAIRMLNGRQYLYRDTKFVLRIRDENAWIVKGNTILQLFPKSEAVRGGGFMEPIFDQLGIRHLHAN